ncbi:MAG: SDR family oxidoreductase [Planctomycetota bacterium]|jgi:3-oxoacyl-[acyl-carrier protein] reductase
MDLNLKSRKALVVAASSGLGAACAEALSREGAKVAICSRDPERIREAASVMEKKTGNPVIAFPADISDPEAIEGLARQVRSELGGLDILVTNCGGPPPGDFKDLSRDQWEVGINGILVSVLELSRAFIPDMTAQGWGRVVMVTSVSARHPIDGLMVSNTLRAGLLGLVRSLAREYGSHGVLVNCVLPGYMATERLIELAAERAAKAGISEEELRARWEAEIPLQRIADPAELGNVVAFLSSDRASYVTGSAITVDGGYSRGLP